MSRMQGLTLPANLTSFLAKQREQADKLRAQHGVEPQPWYRITNAASADEAEVMLYDEVGGWYGATAESFIAELQQVTAPNLRVRINSPGGSVFEGIAIANALRSYAGTVTCQIDGIAASIASVIAMAADRVEMAPQTMLMIHEASGLCMGDASDMEEMGELLDLISDNIADAYASRAGGTREQWREAMRAESWYLPDDAVKAGLADEAILTPKSGEPVTEPEPEGEEPEPEMRKQFDLAAYGYQGPKQPEPPKPTPSAATSAPAASQPTLTIDIASLLDEETVAKLRAAVQPPAPDATAPTAGPQNVAQQFQPGDRVRVTVTPHEEGQDVGSVDEINGNAYGITFDGMEEMGVHRWYVDNELEPADGTPDRTPAEAPAAEPEDEWAALVAHLAEPDPDPWAGLVSHLTAPTASSSAATEAA